MSSFNEKKLWALIILLFVYIKENAYRIHSWYMSKDDAINIMIASNLVDKGVFYKLFLLYIKNE